MTLDLTQIRAQFPALKKRDVFFDNPAGTQVPVQVIQRMTDYLTTCNANHGGVFATSKASDAVIDEAREAVADFYNAIIGHYEVNPATGQVLPLNRDAQTFLKLRQRLTN